MKKTFFLPLLLVLIGASCSFSFDTDTNEEPMTDVEPNTTVVSTYQECVDAGYPVQESYPEKCVDSKGNTYVHDIGNALEKADLIRVTSPQVDATISSPVRVEGTARGYWFFEGEFPVYITDANGDILGRGNAIAGTEWMVESFVPFVVDITFDTPTTPTGSVYLQKANPSDLPEHDDELRVPITF